jgi:hypothetical protein
MVQSHWPGRRAFLAAPLLVVAAGRAAAQSAVVGTVSRLAGAPTVVAEGASAPAPATVGMAIREGDRVITGPGGRLEVTGADGTTITVGEQTTVVVTRFLAPRGRRRGNGLIDMIEGILRIRLPGSWDRFDVTTGTAVASVRSTEWLVDATAASTGVFVFDGRVQVTGQPRTASVTLDPTFGTDVAATMPPTAPRVWGQPRIDAALARLAIP